MPSHEYKIMAPIRKDIESMNVMWAQSWLDTYPNEVVGINRAWVEDKVKDWQGEEAVEKRWQAIRKSIDRNALWRVAKNNKGRVIGVIAPYRNEEVQRLGAIYIDKDYYGTGLAQALMKEILAWSDQSRPLELEVASYNERAKAFYRKYDFKEVKDSEHLVHEIIPVVKMIREGDKQ